MGTDKGSSMETDGRQEEINPLPRAHRKNIAKEREQRQLVSNKGRSTETDGKQGELGVPKVPREKNSIEQQ